VLVGDEVDP